MAVYTHNVFLILFSELNYSLCHRIAPEYIFHLLSHVPERLNYINAFCWMLKCRIVNNAFYSQKRRWMNLVPANISHKHCILCLIAGYSDDLLKVRLPLTKQEDCVRVFRELTSTSTSYKKVIPNGIVGTMLCAGEPKGGKDTCQVRQRFPYLLIPCKTLFTYTYKVKPFKKIKLNFMYYL